MLRVRVGVNGGEVTCSVKILLGRGTTGVCRGCCGGIEEGRGQFSERSTDEVCKQEEEEEGEEDAAETKVQGVGVCGMADKGSCSGAPQVGVGRTSSMAAPQPVSPEGAQKSGSGSAACAWVSAVKIGFECQKKMVYDASPYLTLLECQK